VGRLLPSGWQVASAIPQDESLPDLTILHIKGQLGYQLKGPESQVCAQCHGQKEDMSFVKLHDKHVKDKRKDCSTCHNFSRPGRGLSTSLDKP